MNYEDVIADFATRTKKNLELIRRLQAEDPESEIYEVTQLVNSMLGLLVFPKERYFKEIPETSLAELEAQGWPIPKMRGDFKNPETLRQLIRLLRNSIAHFNLEFVVNERQQISGLILCNMQRGKKTWEAELSLGDLEGITERFIELLCKR